MDWRRFRTQQRLQGPVIAALFVGAGFPPCVWSYITPGKGDTFTRYAPRAEFDDGENIGGHEGDWKRYRHMQYDEKGNSLGITDLDRQEASKRSRDVMCPACEALIGSLVSKAKRKTEDGIMEFFEDDTLPDHVRRSWKPGLDQQLDQVNHNRKHCNKHFKDEMLYEGWAIESCITNTKKEWCLTKGPKPTEEQVETFHVNNEVFWYVCSATVGSFGTEIASYVAEKIEDGVPIKEAVKGACYEAADCDGAKLRKRQQRKRKGRKGSKKSDL